MKVKIIKTCWYGNKYYEPELMTEDELIIDYPCDDIKKLPSWAKVVGSAKVSAQPKKNDSKGEGKPENNTKVSELPVVEKNALLEEAKSVGIDGNQILGWKVDTLKAKIAAKRQNKTKTAKAKVAKNNGDLHKS